MSALESSSPEDTRRLGEALGRAAEAGDVVSAYGTSVPRDAGATALAVALYGPGDGRSRGPLLTEADTHIIDRALVASGRYTLLFAHELGGEVRVRLACTGGRCRAGGLEDRAEDRPLTVRDVSQGP